MIQALLLVNNQILISQIYQVDADPGEPNCRLVDPYVFTLDRITELGFSLTPWMSEVTDDNYAMIDPRNIITIREPKKEVLREYKKLTFISEDAQENSLDESDDVYENDSNVVEAELA